MSSAIEVVKNLYVSSNGVWRPASLYEICEWWVKTYPSDIFVFEPKEVIEVRKQMELILKKRKVLGGKQNEI